MLIELMSGEIVTTVPYEDEFHNFMSRLADAEVASIKAELNRTIDGAGIYRAEWMRGKNWSGTPFQSFYEIAADRNDELAARFFGLIVWQIFKERHDRWKCYQFEMGERIGRWNYFRVTESSSRPVGRIGGIKEALDRICNHARGAEEDSWAGDDDWDSAYTATWRHAAEIALGALDANDSDTGLRVPRLKERLMRICDMAERAAANRVAGDDDWDSASRAAWRNAAQIALDALGVEEASRWPALASDIDARKR